MRDKIVKIEILKICNKEKVHPLLSDAIVNKNDHRILFMNDRRLNKPKFPCKSTFMRAQ